MSSQLHSIACTARHNAQFSIFPLLLMPFFAQSSDAALRFLGGSPGAVARSVLTEIFLRRLAKLTDEDEFIVEDY